MIKNTPADKQFALRRLATWADTERYAHEKRVEWAIEAFKEGATFTELATASKLSRQGLGRAIKKLGIKVDNQVGEA